MPFPAVLLVFVLAAPASASAVVANADFERVQKPGEGKYACPFASWLFIARSGEYSISGDQAERDQRTAVIRCTGEEGRADLMSQGMEIPPLTEVRLRLRVWHEGATTAVVALHPPMNRGLVDVALIDLPRKGWGHFETRLKTATKEGSYRITVTLIGGGTLHVDDIELDVGEQERPVGRVMIVDLNPRLEDYVVPDGAAGGVLMGSYPNPALALLSVDSQHIRADAVTSAEVDDWCLQSSDIAPNGLLALSSGSLSKRARRTS